MNQELLEEAIENWEPTGIEIVRTIDSEEMTVERIYKYFTHRAGETLYNLNRYFQYGTGTGSVTVACSVDLEGVTADEVIQHLAERL